MGLILAGGVGPNTRMVEISRWPGYGLNFEELADTLQTYTPARGLFGACLVMIDDFTLFMIGGRTGGRCWVIFQLQVCNA